MKDNPDRYYTTAEAARLCNLSTSTVFRAIQNNLIQAFSTPGGHFRITRSSLQAFAVKNKIPIEEWEQKQEKALIFDPLLSQIKLLERVLERDFFMDVTSTQNAKEGMAFLEGPTAVVYLLNLDMDEEVVSQFMSELDKKSADLKKRLIGITKDSMGINTLSEKWGLSTEQFLTKPIKIRPFKVKIQGFLGRL